jgi:hypothetical protein
MSWIAIGVGGGAAVIGGVSSYMGSSKMAKAQKDAMKAQIAEEEKAMEMYKQAVAKAEPLFKPYQEAGTQSFKTMADLMRPGGYLYNAPDMTDFRADPQYQHLKNQAMEGARSGGFSGQAMIDAERKASEIADQSYQSIYSRKVGEQGRLASGLGSMADTGKWATGGLASLYTGNANNMANIYGRMGETRSAGIRGIGESQASGIMGMGSALSSGIGLGLNQYNAGQNKKSYNDIIARLTPQNTSSYMPPPPSGGYGTYTDPGSLPTLNSYGGNW